MTPSRKWQIDSDQLDFRNPGPLTHHQACEWLAGQFEITRSLHSDPGVREDLFQALAKVGALIPQQTADWTIIIPGRLHPVGIRLTPYTGRTGESLARPRQP